MRGSRFLDLHLWVRSNRWLAVALLALGIVVSGAIVGYELLKRPADVHNQEAIRHFRPQKPPPPKEPKTVNWPFYGLNPARTKYLSVKGIKPPFDKLWRFTEPGRAESSPVVIDRTVYFGCENGELFAMSTGKGNVRWSTPLGGPIKSAPAYDGRRIYLVGYWSITALQPHRAVVAVGAAHRAHKPGKARSGGGRGGR